MSEVLWEVNAHFLVKISNKSNKKIGKYTKKYQKQKQKNKKKEYAEDKCRESSRSVKDGNMDTEQNAKDFYFFSRGTDN